MMMLPGLDTRHPTTSPVREHRRGLARWTPDTRRRTRAMLGAAVIAAAGLAVGVGIAAGLGWLIRDHDLLDLLVRAALVFTVGLVAGQVIVHRMNDRDRDLETPHAGAREHGHGHGHS